MKYTVNINQAAAIWLNADLDFNDIAVLEFVKDFATSGHAMTITDDCNRTYYWVSHQLVMDELPMLHIKSKSGIKKRLQRLIDAGLLLKHPNCDKLGLTFYAFGEKMSRLYTDNPFPESSIDYDAVRREAAETPTQTHTPRPEKITPDPNGTTPPTLLGLPPRPKSVGNNKYNNINEINDNRKNTPTPDAPEIEFSEVEEIAAADVTTESNPTPPSCAVPPRPKSATAKTLFRNSEVADRGKFFDNFKDDAYKDIDMEYYYNAVADWSDSSNTMRTARGWLATVRTFIRGDKEKNKLHRKQSTPAQGGLDWNFARNYLNNKF